MNTSYSPEGKYTDIESHPGDLVSEIFAEPADPSTAKEAYLAFHRDFCARMIEVTQRKNADYTGSDPDPFANFRVVEKLGVCSVEVGFLVRMSDKFIRISNLADGRQAQVKDEAIDDTLHDLANYAALFAAYLASKRETK
jgi:hypothetical protein